MVRGPIKIYGSKIVRVPPKNTDLILTALKGDLVYRFILGRRIINRVAKIQSSGTKP